MARQASDVPNFVPTARPAPEGTSFVPTQAASIRDRGITARGAPARVRAAVGAARGPDKISTLRNFYPDAVPWGDDNFVYTGEDGQVTLMNPEGLDWGDLAGAAPEIASMVGGTLGAVAGSPGGPPGSIAMSGAGAAAGQKMAEAAVNQLIPESIESRGLIEQARDTTQDALYGAVGEGTGRLAAEAGESALRNLLVNPQTAREVVGEADALGIDPSGLAAETGGRPLTRMTTNALSSIPSSANTINEARSRTIDSMADRLTGVSQRRTQGQGAQALREGQEVAASGFWDQERAMRQRMTDEIGTLPVTPATMPETNALVNKWAEAIEASPNTAGHLQSAMEEARGLLGDAQEGGIPYDLLRERMTHITQSLTNPMAGTGYVGKAGQAMKQLERALRSDARETVARTAPDSAPLVAEYDDFVRTHLTPGGSGKSPAQTLEQMGKRETDQLMNYAMGGAKGGGERLRMMRDIMPAENWEQFSQSVLQRMGARGGGTEDFSLAQFTTRWREMDEQARRELFGKEYEFLDRMAKMGERIKVADMERNVSKTAQTLLAAETLQGVTGGALGAASGADPLTAVAAGAGSVALPWGVAKGLTSPGFANFAQGGNIPLARGIGGMSTRALIESGALPELYPGDEEFGGAGIEARY